MGAAAAKAFPRKDLTEKQPAVEVQRDAMKPTLQTLVELQKKFAAERFSSFHSSTSTRLPFFPPEAAATGHNTVRFPRVGFNAMGLTASPKRSITPIERIQKSGVYGPTVFDANAKDPYGVADVSHVVFPADTLAGSWSSSAPFDQMLGYSLALDGGRAVLVNPHEVLDGGRVVLANPDGALDRGGAVLVNPHEVLDGGRVVLANLHGAAVALAVATLYGGANGAGDVLANLYGAGAFRVVLANLYGAADRGRVVFADPNGAADRVHGGAVNMGHTRAPGCSFALANPDGALDGGRAVFADLYGAANRVHDIAVHRGHARALADEANDACIPSDEANDV